MIVSSKTASHFLQYAVAGVIAFACEYTTFLALYYRLDLPIVVANSIAFVVGLTVSFALSKLWVFRHGVGTKTRQASLFVALALFNLVLTNLLLVLLKHYGIAPVIGKLAVMCLIVLWNFIILRNFIFVDKRSPQP